MEQEICKAIARKSLLKFEYDTCMRVVEPHCYGISTTGAVVLRAYQVSGESRSGGIPNWRLFEHSKMSSVQILETFFSAPRQGYNPNDPAIFQVICQV